MFDKTDVQPVTSLFPPHLWGMLELEQSVLNLSNYLFVKFKIG